MWCRFNETPVDLSNASLRMFFVKLPDKHVSGIHIKFLLKEIPSKSCSLQWSRSHIYLFSTNNINSCSSLENCQGSLQQSKETDITIQILSKHYHYPNKSCGNSSSIVNPFISIGLLSKPAPPPPHTHTWGLEYAVLWKYYGCAVLLPWDCLMCLSLHISLITETNEDCF